MIDIVMCLLPVICFCIGMKIGKEYKHVPQEKPSIKRYFKPKNKSKFEDEKEKIIYQNIENYGTNVPQKDVM